MTGLEKIGAAFAVVLPVLGGVWWAGSGYMEFNDRLAKLEEDTTAIEEDIAALEHRWFQAEREQAQDALVNDQVRSLETDVEWLKFHHHDAPGGRAHVD